MILDSIAAIVLIMVAAFLYSKILQWIDVEKQRREDAETNVGSEED